MVIVIDVPIVGALAGFVCMPVRDTGFTEGSRWGGGGCGGGGSS